MGIVINFNKIATFGLIVISIIVGAIVGVICGKKASQKKDNNVSKENKSNKEKLPIILISSSFFVIVISMIILLSKISSDFYKSLFIFYIPVLIPNIIFLIYVVNKKVKQETLNKKSIILLSITIIYVILFSVIYTHFYNEHIGNMNDKKDEAVKKFKCETQYNGRWIGNQCYYENYKGEIDTIIP